jgi:hypothetical protein
MNKLYMIMMIFLVLGLTASNVSAECALNAKNLHIEYNELSAAEFFYGIPVDNRNDTATATRNTYADIPGEASLVESLLDAPELFYGYSIPDRLEATKVICNINAWGETDSRANVSAVSNPADFFGYTNEGYCSNC